MRSTLRVVFLAAMPALANCAWDDLVTPVESVIAARVHVGDDFACALDGDRQVRCWGANFRGQLGDGSTRLSLVPQPVAGDLVFSNLGIHGTGQHACAVTTDAAAYCWGENDFGQLGDGTTTHRSTPVPVAGDQEFRSISAGWRFSCGVTVDDTGYCWGRGVWGQLGDGRATQSLTPVPVSGDLRFSKIEVGTNNLACALTREGRIFCWGLDRLGSLGGPAADSCTQNTFTLPCARAPLEVMPETTFRDVAVGFSFACAVSVAGHPWCWGANGDGQTGSARGQQCPVGNSAAFCTLAPTRLETLGDIHSITAGDNHACAVALDGRGFCWGRNRWGELGDGDFFSQSTEPVPVRGRLSFATISAGRNHTCGATRDGALYCWGINDLGQMGDGTTNLSLAPVRVIGVGGGGGVD